jgi:3-oxoacyl-[acyl-carrier-protein] synthase II
MSRSDDIVITGLGVVSPIGVGEAEFWQALYAGKSGAAPIDCLDTTDLPRKNGCQVKGSDEATKRRSDEGKRQNVETSKRRNGAIGGEAEQARPRIGRAAQLAIEAASQAAADAGVAVGGGCRADEATAARRDASGIDPGRVAIVVGTTMGETEFIEDCLAADANEWLSPQHVCEILSGRPGSIAAHVANRLLNEPTEGAGSDSRRTLPADQSPNRPIAQSPNARSPVAIDLYGACAAGNMAIESARRRLLDGRCDLAIAGGADGFSRLAFIGFMRLRVMAAEVCRPFDVDRDGLFVGEGAAMFVLERESAAKARGAGIRARILGTGNACENYHPTRPHPEGDGLSRAVLAALADAGVGAGDVDYVCAHGTGTPQNDAIEVTVMNRLFPAGTPFSSIKALTGHTMGAAAAVEAAACVLMLKRQTLIPTWNLRTALQPCECEALAGAPRAARLGTVINNSAGFGGYNSSVVIAAP